jgi:TRAP-type mannitol/chloroaromatic compound transport system permease large subunit
VSVAVPGKDNEAAREYLAGLSPCPTADAIEQAVLRARKVFALIWLLLVLVPVIAVAERSGLPNFVFMGSMLDKSGMADRLMQSFTRLFGSLQGGLAISVCPIGMLLAASTGIVGASVVLLATLSLPLMMAYGYSRQLAAGVVAASGTLGILIPPSIMLVIMAEQLSMLVGDLFMGAMIPGLLLGLLYMVYVIII